METGIPRGYTPHPMRWLTLAQLIGLEPEVADLL